MRRAYLAACKSSDALITEELTSPDYVLRFGAVSAIGNRYKLAMANLSSIIDMTLDTNMYIAQAARNTLALTAQKRFGRIVDFGPVTNAKVQQRLEAHTAWVVFWKNYK